MKRFASLVALGVTIGVLPICASAQAEPLVIHVSAVFDGLSQTPARCIVIENGIVTAIGAEDAVRVPAAARHLHVHDGVATPAFVLARGLGAPPGDSRSVTPERRALDGYDPFTDPVRFLNAGICALHLAPGSARLLSGQGAVVRLGAVPASAPLAASSDLFGALLPATYASPVEYESPVAPSTDVPFSDGASRVVPGSRAAAGLILRRLFEAAGLEGAQRASVLAQIEEECGLETSRLDLEPLARARAKNIPWRVRADAAADIDLAIDVAREFGLRLVIEGGREAHLAATDLAALDASVILAVGRLPGAPLPPPEPFEGSGERLDPDAAGQLLALGVGVALVPPSGSDPSEILVHAARAVGPRFRPTDVLAGLTGRAAAALGVEDRVGRLAVGRAADLLVFDHDPESDLSARPILVISHGRVVADRRESRDGLVAIGGVGSTVHVGNGTVLRDHWVLVERGRIAGCVPDDDVPSDAHRVRFARTIVPGFIDGGGQAGMRSLRVVGDGVVPGPRFGQLAMDKRATEFFDVTFPDLRAVARSGVTTLALTPSGGRPDSGVISVVKTAARSGKAVVLDETAGVLVDHSGSRYSEATADAFASGLTAARQYADSWTAYEKALAEWTIKNPTAATESKEKRKLGELKAPSTYDPVSGTWEGTVEMRPGLNIPALARFVRDGEKVTGTLESTLLPGGKVEVQGTYANEVLELSLTVQGTSIRVRATVRREELEGTWEADGQGSGRVALRRTERPETKDTPADPKGSPTPAEPASGAKKPAEPTPTKGNEKPSPPRTQAALEPYREVFGGTAAVFLAVRDRRLAEVMLPALSKAGARTVLLTPELVPAGLDLLVATNTAFCISPPGLRWDDGARSVNVARVAAFRGVVTGFRSGWEGDPRSLYEDAAFAVARGLPRGDALAALSSAAARLLGVDGNVGTLERGKDADIVLLDGVPFAPGTRVHRVMIDGVFVEEASQP